MLTPHEAEETMIRIAHKLEEQTDALAELLMAAAEADVTYRVAYAKAILRAEGKVAEQEAKATLECEEILFRRKTTEAIADACRESVRSLRDQLSAAQSANANVRSLAGLDR